MAGEYYLRHYAWCRESRAASKKKPAAGARLYLCAEHARGQNRLLFLAIPCNSQARHHHRRARNSGGQIPDRFIGCSGARSQRWGVATGYWRTPTIAHRGAKTIPQMAGLARVATASRGSSANQPQPRSSAFAHIGQAHRHDKRAASSTAATSPCPFASTTRRPVDHQGAASKPTWPSRTTPHKCKTRRPARPCRRSHSSGSKRIQASGERPVYPNRAGFWQSGDAGVGRGDSLHLAHEGDIPRSRR